MNRLEEIMLPKYCKTYHERSFQTLGRQVQEGCGALQKNY